MPIKKQLVQNEMKHDQALLFVGSSFTDIKDKLYKMAIFIVCCVQEGMSYDCFVIWESVIFDQFAVLMFAPCGFPLPQNDSFTRFCLFSVVFLNFSIPVALNSMSNN